MQLDLMNILCTNILNFSYVIHANGIKGITMKDNDILEMLRWYDIPDCKKYKELLESKDKEVIRLAIELLTIDKVEKCQIDRCREVFLHEYRWDEK